MWAPGGAPGPAGWDRRRVGARLRAALAGLHELQGLRARQQARVRGALAMLPAPAPPAPRGPHAHELRLDAALTALQEQLNHLRHQDIGLKTHLDQLDQQISKLQLGMRRTSAEGPDSDSRPSSGFYELSDGGSCSLSASCTSVCSDRVSSSLSALLPTTLTSRPGAGDCRPHSADETTVHGAPLSAWRPQAAEEGSARPRPVSTGDLERVIAAKVGLQKASAEPRPASLLCHMLDPKYQRDLVSKGGREAYLYPSPLHAVALQSPLFALTRETPQRDGPSPPSEPPPGSPGPSSIQTPQVLRAGPAAAYIDRLLRLRGHRIPPRASASEQEPTGHQGPPGLKEPSGQRADSKGSPQKLACSPGSAGAGGVAPRGDAGGDSLEQQGPALLVGAPRPSSLPEEGPKPSRGCTRGESIPGAPQPGHGQAPAPCSWAPRAALGCQKGTAVSLAGKAGREIPSPVPRHPAHTPVVAGAGLKTGHTKKKAVKIKKGAGDPALRSGRQRPPQGAPAAPQLPPEWGLGLRRGPTLVGEAPGRSCSEPRLYPVPFLIPLLVACREGHRASAQALLPLEAAPLPLATAGRETRGRQFRWLSAVEVSARARPAGIPEPSLAPRRPTARRGGGLRLRPLCAQARSQLPCQGGHARSESDGSEHSAECASLLHSTVAETSEDQASDHTTSRFGDGESSGSDLEGGARGSGHRLAWPRATPQQPPLAPARSRSLLPLVPKLCRIKASKALKKKIRRSQLATLKVMTMV
ncbi:Dapper-like 2 [Manis pentadactyla]|nr:Dapper-like 2 [Manis pentadactyla]